MSDDFQYRKGCDVLHLADFDLARPARIFAEMRSYWQSLRNGRAIPSRNQVDPKGIRRALDYAFILERIAPGAARFRLAGRHLIDLMGMEVRGMPLAAFMNPTSRGRMSDVLESVFQGPQIAEFQVNSEAGYGRPELKGRMLLLPLRSDLGDVTRIMGALIAEGETGIAPRRFDIASEVIEPVIPGAKVMEPTPSGFAESPPLWLAPRSDHVERPPLPPETPDERRARFRIVRNED